MRLYLDENVPVPLATALAEHGIDCLTTRDAGNRGHSDEEQLTFATQEQRSLVTFNCKDFLSLATRWQEVGRSHTGMILSKELPLPELIRRFRHLAIRCRDRNLRDIIIWLPVIRQPPLVMGQETVAGAVFQRMVVRRIGRMLGLPVFEVVRPPLLILAKRRPSWERLEVFGDKLV